MATVEQLLVQIGLDPASVNKFLTDIETVKAQGEEGAITLSVQSNAGETINRVSVGLKNLGKTGRAALNQLQEGFQQVERAAGTLRTGVLALGATFGIGIGAAVRSAAEESRNLANANVILKFSTEELAEAQQDLRRVADATGISFTDISAALFDVASAGFSGARAIEVVTAAARVARPAGTDVATAFNAIATAMNNFGISADEAGDKLVKIADITRGTLGDVSQAIGRLGPLGANLGLGLDEIGAAFALLTNRGIPAAQAITQLQSVINSILKPAESSEEAFRKLSIQTGDTAFRNQDLAEKLDIVNKALADGSVQVTELFRNANALKGAITLIGATEDFNDNVTALAGSFGRTQEALDSFFQLSGPALDKLGADFFNLLTVVGEDFLNALVGTIRSLSQFIIENRELIAVAIEAGAIFAGLIVAIAGLTFVFKQLNAAFDLTRGLIKIFTSEMVLSTVTTEANTAATEVNTGARTALGIVASIVGRALRATRTFLLLETGVIARSTLAWLVNAVARGKVIAVSIIAFLGRVTGLWIIETAAVNANTAAQTANVAARGGLIGALARVGTALVTSVGALSLAAVATGVLAAAFIGFKIGSFINDQFGISKALAESTRQQELLAQARSEANLTENQEAILEEIGVREEFNRILKESSDLTRTEAFNQAISTQQRIGFLKRLQDANTITATQTAELVKLERQLNAEIEASTSRTRELAEASKDAAQARINITAREEDFQKALQETADALVAIRRGTEAAQIRATQRGADERFTILEDQAADEIALVRKTTAEIVAARAAGGDETALTGLVSTLEEQEADLRRTTSAIADTFEVFNRSIAQSGEEALDRIRQQGQARIDISRKVADEVIKNAQREAQEAEREIQKLVDIRNRGVASSTAALDRLRQQAIAQIDPALAELRRLEQQALRDFSGAPAAVAEEAIGLIAAQIERLSGATRDETRAQQQLAAANERLADLQVQRGRAVEKAEEAVNEERGNAESAVQRVEDIDKRILDTLEQQKSTQEDLTRLQELRTQRTEAAEESQERIAEFLEGAADRQLQQTLDIEDQQQKLQTALETEKRLRQELLIEEQNINAELDKRIKKEQILIRQNQELLRLRTDFALAASAGQDEASLNQLQSAVDRAQRRVKALELETTRSFAEAEVAIKGGEAEATSAFNELAAGLRRQQEQIKAQADAAKAIVPLADELERSQAASAAAQASITTTIDDVLKKTIDAGNASTDFQETTNTTFSRVGTELQKQADRTSSLERTLAQTKIETVDEKGSSGL